MNRIFKYFMLLTISFFCFSNKSFSSPSENITINVESSALHIAKNQKNIKLYVNINLPQNWYTYYKNPGDIGVKTKISWKDLPKGVKVSPILYPIPKKLTDQGFTNYVYKEKQLQLPFLLNLDNYSQKTLSLNGKAEFLICNNTCVPIIKDFHKKIDINHTTSVNNDFDFSIFAGLPQKHEPTEFLAKTGNIYIKLDPKVKSKALLIPDSDDVINDSAKQEIIELNGDKYLKIPQDEKLSLENTKTLKGLLITDAGNFITQANFKNFPIIEKTNFTKLAIIAMFALLGGMLLNLMPCVLPIIGLKIFSLIKHESPKERIKAVMAYSAGIFISMMMIVAALLILKALGNSVAWGFQLQNEAFVWGLIILLIFVGLDLLDIISVGNFISKRVSVLSNKYSGEFFAGFLTSFIASSCSAPFMATSIGFALASNSNIIILSIFSFFALGMASPLILIAIVPKSHKIIPTPGQWMEGLKHFLALPIFATVIWLIWILYGLNTYVSFLVISLCFITILWALTTQGKFRLLSTLISITISAWIVHHMLNLQPELSHAERFNKEQIIEFNKQNKTVFVDFAAKWCITCEFNQLSVLHTERTQELLRNNNIIYMIADWTKKDEAITKELTLLKQAGVPTYAIYSPNRKAPVILPNILTFGILEDYIKRIKKNTK
ncbi:MAG: hypothetical protein GY793_10800 [Proteobacteria bacterium]|nr:hypothetical protein [Pseudomonadota bacterium]